MKNKYMTKAVQNLLPEEYICHQCGIVKLFCVYGSEGTEAVWRDPGIIGVGALLTQNSTYSTYIRIYACETVYYVCLHSSRSLSLKFSLNVNFPSKVIISLWILFSIVLKRKGISLACFLWVINIPSVFTHMLRVLYPWWVSMQYTKVKPLVGMIPPISRYVQIVSNFIPRRGNKGTDIVADCSVCLPEAQVHQPSTRQTSPPPRQNPHSNQLPIWM